MTLVRSLQQHTKNWSKRRYWLKTINASILHSIMHNLVSKIHHWVRDRVLAFVSWWSHITSIDLQWCIAFPIPTDKKLQEWTKLPPQPSKQERDLVPLPCFPLIRNSSSDRTILLFPQAASKEQICSGSINIYSQNNWQRRLAAYANFQ